MPLTFIFRSLNQSTTDDCEDVFLQEILQGSLPFLCDGAELDFGDERGAVSNSRQEERSDRHHNVKNSVVGSVEAGPLKDPSLNSQSVASHGLPLGWRPKPTAHAVEFSLNGAAPLASPTYTPRPEAGHRSFQALLRSSLSSFSQRMSMLERGSLDTKESLQALISEQGILHARLERLTTALSATQELDPVTQLEKGYLAMETRLSQLEDNVKVLIDVFTELAQEISKIKRLRHKSQPAPMEQFAPLIAAVPMPTLLPTEPAVRKLRSKSLNRLHSSRSSPSLIQRPTVPQLSRQHNTPNTPVSPFTIILRKTNRKPMTLFTLARPTAEWQGKTLELSKNNSWPNRTVALMERITRLGKRQHAIRTNKQSRQTKSMHAGKNLTSAVYQLLPSSHKVKAQKKQSKDPFTFEFLTSTQATIKAPYGSRVKAQLSRALRSHAKAKSTSPPTGLVLRKTPSSDHLNRRLVGRMPSLMSVSHQLAPPSQAVQSYSELTPYELLFTSTPPCTTSTRQTKFSVRSKTENNTTQKLTVTKRKRPKVHDILKLLHGDLKHKERQKQHHSVQAILGRLGIYVKMIPNY